MNESFQHLTPADEKLFYRSNDRHDARLGVTQEILEFGERIGGVVLHPLHREARRDVLQRRGREIVADRAVSHGGADASHTQVAQLDDGCEGVAIFADAGKCTDKALMDTASPPPSVDLKLLSLTAVIATTLALPPLPPTLSIHQTVAAPIRDDRLVDPRMEIRRTVVLLI